MKLMQATRWVGCGVAIVLVAGLAGVAGVRAQGRDSGVEVRLPGGIQPAEETRDQFRQLMAQFPPALGVVLKSDPSLLSNAGYLATYPALVKYLTDHPEIARNPDYFLQHVETVQYVDYRYGGRRSNEPMTSEELTRMEAINMWRNTMDSFLFLLGFATAAFVLAWIIRYIVEHRRWLRATRIQSEAHNKLLERFSSSAELATYMESPAGAQFLKAAPLSIEAGNRKAPGAPFSRILWSAQAGVVLVAAGIGFLIIQRRMIDEVAQMMSAWGTLSIAIGIGFVISGAASYVISSRLGLLDEPKP
jgi:hypothetical protein